MSQNNPQIEHTTIWGFTEEDIRHRWKVHMEFDPVSRLFGSEDKEKKSPKITNDGAAFNFLENLLTKSG